MSPQSGAGPDRNASTATINPTPMSTHHGVEGLFATLITNSDMPKASVHFIVLYEKEYR